MAKLRVKEMFYDLEADIFRYPGSEFEVTNERLSELQEKSAEFGGFDIFFERLDEPKNKKKAAEDTPDKQEDS